MPPAEAFRRSGVPATVEQVEHMRRLYADQIDPAVIVPRT